MSARLLVGDAAVVLGTLEAGSVQLCVTSPPYFGLRSYQAPDTVFGGDAGCEHDFCETIIPPQHSDDGAAGSTLVGSTTRQGACQRTVAHATCRLCSAWRGQLGLEPTPDLY